jgi:hypothetical protein
MIIPKLLRIKSELENCEGVYLLDHRGVQISPTFTSTKQIDDDVGRIRADRAYYYRAVKEGRCTLTDPYPSLITGDLTITVSMPIYDEKDDLKYEIYCAAERIVKLEDSFIDLCFENAEVPDLTAEEIKEYIRYIADRRLLGLGMKKIFGSTSNPLTWLDYMLNGVEHTNFFENRATEYSKASTTGNWKDIFK